MQVSVIKRHFNFPLAVRCQRADDFILVEKSITGHVDPLFKCLKFFMSFRYELKPPSNIEIERRCFRLKFCDDACRYRAICQCTRLLFIVRDNATPLVRAGDTRWLQRLYTMTIQINEFPPLSNVFCASKFFVPYNYLRLWYYYTCSYPIHI